MPKLTLSVEENVIRRAKRYAAQRRTSLSRLVEQFLDLLSRSPEADDMPPVLRRLRGSLEGAAVDTYREHLRRKHR